MLTELIIRGGAGWLSQAASNRGIVSRLIVDVQQTRETLKHAAMDNRVSQ